MMATCDTRGGSGLEFRFTRGGDDFWVRVFLPEEVGVDIRGFNRRLHDGRLRGGGGLGRHQGGAGGPGDRPWSWASRARGPPRHGEVGEREQGSPWPTCTARRHRAGARVSIGGRAGPGGLKGMSPPPLRHAGVDRVGAGSPRPTCTAGRRQPRGPAGHRPPPPGASYDESHTWWHLVPQGRTCAATVAEPLEGFLAAMPQAGSPMNLLF
jgi:hypothetical protein